LLARTASGNALWHRPAFQISSGMMPDSNGSG
jgi:hypothetical protein